MPLMSPGHTLLMVHVQLYIVKDKNVPFIQLDYDFNFQSLMNTLYSGLQLFSNM